MEYKLKKSTSWNFLYKKLVITYVLHLIFFCLLIWVKNIDSSITMLVLLAISIAWVLFFATPAIILFFNHHKHSRGVVLKINAENFVYKNLSGTIQFKLKDIKKVEVHLTPPSFDNRVDFLYLSAFFYTSIYTINGDKIELSSLIFSAYERSFPEDLIEKKKMFFPIMGRH